jgi:hypothetical protein
LKKNRFHFRIIFDTHGTGMQHHNTYVSKNSKIFKRNFFQISTCVFRCDPRLQGQFILV